MTGGKVGLRRRSCASTFAASVAWSSASCGPLALMTTATRLVRCAWRRSERSAAAVERPLAGRIVEAKHRRGEAHRSVNPKVDRRDRFVARTGDLRERCAPLGPTGRSVTDARCELMRADGDDGRGERSTAAPIVSATPPSASSIPRTATPHRTTPPRAATNPAARVGKARGQVDGRDEEVAVVRVPPNADRSTCAKTSADARSGGVLSAARHSGCQIAANARRGVAAKRRATVSSAPRKSFRARRRNPAMSAKRSATTDLSRTERRPRDGAAPARSTPRR